MTDKTKNEQFHSFNDIKKHDDEMIKTVVARSAETNKGKMQLSDEDANAMKKAYQERAKQWNLVLWIATLFLILLLSTLGAEIIARIGKYAKSDISIIKTTILLLPVLCLGLLILGFRKVNQNYEYTVEFFGQLFDVWESGIHFLFPGMMISGKVYMNDRTVIFLYKNQDDIDKDVDPDGIYDVVYDSPLDIMDTSVGFEGNLVYRIFSSIRAVYNVDDLEAIVLQNVKAGLRAIFSPKVFEEANASTQQINIQILVEQDATNACLYKKWGAEMVSLSISDFKLQKAIVDKRDELLIVSKEKEIEEKRIPKTAAQAEQTRIMDEVKGTGMGQQIKRLSKEAGITEKDAADFIVAQKTADGLANGNNKVIFAPLESVLAKLGTFTNKEPRK
jgi:hypothetical protein